MSEESSDTTDKPSISQSPQSSASPSPLPVSRTATVCSTVVSLACACLVVDAWKDERIKDWRYALAALIVIAAPADALRVVKFGISKVIK